MDRVDGPLKLVLSVLMFPLLFQDPMIRWAWGANDELQIQLLKRVFLVLPSAAIILGCWVTIGCFLTVIIRQNRRQYVSTVFITWWDLGRAIFSFWGGTLKIVTSILGWALAFIRLAILGVWLSIQDILLTPWRMVKGVGGMASEPGTPWIAVWLTLIWCLVEAFVFTFVMTNLVVDTVSNLAGKELNLELVQLVLFFMLLGFVVGSYAIVASLEKAVRTRDVKQIALVLLVELCALTFEVSFLYREFVDALVPWFAQYAGEDFHLSGFAIFSIASIIWAGIRGMTWFLFAAHGTPTIMAIIQRTGLGSAKHKPLNLAKKDHFTYVRAAIEKIKADVDWSYKRGDELLGAFILPPLQVVAACINFLTMLISAKHLFQLPFKSYRDMLNADQLINRVKEKS